MVSVIVTITMVVLTIMLKVTTTNGYLHRKLTTKVSSYHNYNNNCVRFVSDNSDNEDNINKSNYNKVAVNSIHNNIYTQLTRNSYSNSFDNNKGNRNNNHPFARNKNFLQLYLAKSSSLQKTPNYVAFLNYIIATSLQWSLIVSFMFLIQNKLLLYLSTLLSNNTILLTKVQNVLMFLFFVLVTFRSRIFSPLDNKRPSALRNDPVFKERIRPKWQPPIIVFPIVWSTISLLRIISGYLIYKSTNTLLSKPLFFFIAHLSIGDTWNTINNIESRLGTAAGGSIIVWLSILVTLYQYYLVLPKAAYILAPSGVWLSVAMCLVFSIWRVNYEKFKEPSLFPSNEEGPASRWKFTFQK